MHASLVNEDTHREDSVIAAKPADSIKRILMVGPRGIKGFFGWTFFDPVNLVCVAFLGISAVLVVISMRDRLAGDWYMPIGLYLCLATLLRGYIFNYYHGRPVARFLNLLILVFGILAAAILWGERATEHEVLREGGIFHVAPADGFHVAALLHLSAAVALAVHFLLPRHWLIKMTDQMVEKAGQEDFFADEAAAIQLANRDSLNEIMEPDAPGIDNDPKEDGIDEVDEIDSQTSQGLNAAQTERTAPDSNAEGVSSSEKNEEDESEPSYRESETEKD